MSSATPPRSTACAQAAPAGAHTGGRGFTLVELMVVLAIVAIIGALAWPAYTESVQRGRRSDAMVALAQAMQAQERHRSNNATYEGTLANIYPITSPKGYYGLSVVSGTASGTGYSLQASAVATGPQASDSKCSHFVVTMASGTLTYTSSNGNGANGSPDPCWVQ